MYFVSIMSLVSRDCPNSYVVTTLRMKGLLFSYLLHTQQGNPGVFNAIFFGYLFQKSMCLLLCVTVDDISVIHVTAQR